MYVRTRTLVDYKVNVVSLKNEAQYLLDLDITKKYEVGRVFVKPPSSI